MLHVRFQKSRKRFSLLTLANLLIAIILIGGSTSAQNVACSFDKTSLQFIGSPLDQAKCLLRPNKPGGVLDNELPKLPKTLGKLIGTDFKLNREKIRKYLQKHQIDDSVIGGSLNERLSSARLPNGENIQALYFIIHDTSTPNYGLTDFPTEINDQSWKYNKLDMWLKNPVAHIFINRNGESITTTPFSETVRKGWGTKFARDFLKLDAKGLQLHIELIQPRRSNPKLFKGNDQIAPEIGFTEQQYERLALVYMIAGLRRGNWLIPAYHSAIDAGIKDAHDDPQNFNLQKLSDILGKLIKRVS